ncbi:transglycosylase domain-containing protein [Roseibacillus ishigakijimensis]|uniref:Transglycosylase domain-containing protein n=1 Tax=Roseibacillus ishigakijimensis TaxID=454146 RepID=A0A934VJL0_9BACT|nr:transglycosylase domain-containing protein [Roseibacillus ishigakijimensis]MBK1832714.1 transglycosylase domain-containing protein [Roseibacillus ishigakijimensis]
MTWLENDEPGLWEQLPSWVFAMGRIFLRVVGIGCLLAVVVALLYWLQAAQFDLTKVEKMPERTLLLDREGQELAAIHGSRRRLITYEDLPSHLINALTTREDKDFFEHGGVHFRGVARATLRNLRDRSMTQGASTLTMQLARNTFEMREMSFHRKLLEMALAYRLEANFDKKEILTAYLNRIYFGAGAFGIEQAAQSYFGRPTADLSVPEAALLVGIIRAPHAFSPRNDEEAALRERNDVLRNMAIDGHLTPEQRDEFLQAPLHLLPAREEQVDAIRCVRRHLNELLDQNDFASGGLTATSSIDREMQRLARQGIDEILAPFAQLEAALVALDPATGAMRAVITARDAERSQFNRAFDTRRQLGPAFQPFIYAFSAERGHLPIPNQPIQTARQLAPGDLERLARRIGFGGPFTTGDELARGNLQTTTLEVATALATLANEGREPRTYLVESLTDSEGELLFQQQPQGKPALDSFAAQSPFEILGKPTWSALNHPGNDLWALHSSPDLAVALWLGYDEPADVPEAAKLAENATALLTTLARVARIQREERAAEEAAEEAAREFERSR